MKRCCYARRITAPERGGRALAIASIGTPLGLAVGTPLGSWVGTTFGWRWAFAALTALTVVTFILVVTLVPDACGQAAENRTPFVRVFAIPGVTPILAVIATWMIAHNVSYTYMSPYLHAARNGLSVDAALVTFGIAALVGLAVTASTIDRALRHLVFASMVLFIGAGMVLAVGHSSRAAVLSAIILWGIAYGGAATQLQTAIANASGPDADVANSMLGVAFNLAIFTAGVLGAGIISGFGGLALPSVMIALTLLALLIVFTTRSTALPIRR